MLKEHAKPSKRRQDIIHPSEVAKTGWCPRSTLLRIERCRALADPYWKPSESIGVQLLNIFDEGHYIHDKWQRRLWKMGDLWGSYNCLKCNTVYPFQEVKSTCPNELCQASMDVMEYGEITLRNDALLIAGHADGGVLRLKSLIEVKSVGVGTARIEAPDIFKANSEGQKIDLTGLWRDIKEPFPAHVRQGQLYLYLCATMGLDFDQIIFLYESKFNQGAKEFVVKYDYEAVLPMLVQISSIVHALNGGEPVICPFGGCKDCDVYGTESTTDRVGRTPDQDPDERIEGAGKTLRRSSGSSKRIVRPS